MLGRATSKVSDRNVHKGRQRTYSSLDITRIRENGPSKHETCESKRQTLPFAGREGSLAHVGTNEKRGETLVRAGGKSRECKKKSAKNTKDEQGQENFWGSLLAMDGANALKRLDSMGSKMLQAIEGSYDSAETYNRGEEKTVFSRRKAPALVTEDDCTFFAESSDAEEHDDYSLLSSSTGANDADRSVLSYSTRGKNDDQSVISSSSSTRCDDLSIVSSSYDNEAVRTLAKGWKDDGRSMLSSSTRLKPDGNFLLSSSASYSLHTSSSRKIHDETRLGSSATEKDDVHSVIRSDYPSFVSANDTSAFDSTKLSVKSFRSHTSHTVSSSGKSTQEERDDRSDSNSTRLTEFGVERVLQKCHKEIDDGAESMIDRSGQNPIAKMATFPLGKHDDHCVYSVAGLTSLGVERKSGRSRAQESNGGTVIYTEKPKQEKLLIATQRLSIASDDEKSDYLSASQDKGGTSSVRNEKSIVRGSRNNITRKRKFSFWKSVLRDAVRRKFLRTSHETLGSLDAESFDNHASSSSKEVSTYDTLETRSLSESNESAGSMTQETSHSREETADMKMTVQCFVRSRSAHEADPIEMLAYKSDTGINYVLMTGTMAEV